MELTNQDRQLIGIASWNAKLTPAMRGILKTKMTRNGLAPVQLFNRKAEQAMEFLLEYEQTKHDTTIRRLAKRYEELRKEAMHIQTTFLWWVFKRRKFNETYDRMLGVYESMVLVIDCIPEDLTELMKKAVEESLQEQAEGGGKNQDQQDQSSSNSPPLSPAQ